MSPILVLVLAGGVQQYAEELGRAEALALVTAVAAEFSADPEKAFCAPEPASAAFTPPVPSRRFDLPLPRGDRGPHTLPACGLSSPVFRDKL